ncbi:protein transport protein bos1 [Hypoxylon texense]
MASPDQPAPLTVLGRPRPPPQAHGGSAGPGGAAARNAGVTTTISADPATRGDRSPQFEFRGFDFFANRDFNELKNASRAYFTPAGAEKHQRLPSTWLGDATPPSTPRQSRDALPAAGGDIFHSPPRGQTPPGKKRIFGLRRTQFWWLLGLVALLLIVAIGVGVGVGVGKSASESSKAAMGAGAASSSSSSATSGTNLPAETSTITTTTTTSNPSKTTASSTATPTGNSEGKIDCPAANGTIYQVPGSDKSFLRICGIDYSGDEAEDLRQVPTESILDCMKNCAGTAECTGCGWGYLEGDTGTQHTCWLKGGLKKPHEADPNWAFAVLL